jgi:MOSC domain-containing protein YiiM
VIIKKKLSIGAMKVLSVNVGMPKTIEYLGKRVRTGIFKSPVQGTVAVGQFNLEGDRQADLRFHGGKMKSVYAYPSEHYEFWREQLPEVDFFDGVFGENLTTTGLLETDLRRGDRLRIGTAEFEVTVPRYPCYKLGVRFGRKDILRDFAKSGRCGFYLSVIRTGELTAGDIIEYFPNGDGKTIAQIFNERMRQKF